MNYQLTQYIWPWINFQGWIKVTWLQQVVSPKWSIIWNSKSYNYMVQFTSWHLILGGIERSNQGHLVFIWLYIILSVLLDSGAVKPRGLLFGIMMKFLTSWSIFWHHDVKFDFMTKFVNIFLTSWKQEMRCHYVFLYIHSFVMILDLWGGGGLGSEPVGRRSWATELPCFNYKVTSLWICPYLYLIKNIFICHAFSGEESWLWCHWISGWTLPYCWPRRDDACQSMSCCMSSACPGWMCLPVAYRLMRVDGQVNISHTARSAHPSGIRGPEAGSDQH